MKTWHRLAWTALCSLLMACSSGGDSGKSNSGGDSSGDIDASQGPEIGGAPDFGRAQEITVPEDTSASDVGPDAEPEPPGEPAPEGEPDGDGLIVSPESFEGLFIYGLGVDPLSGMAFIGNTPAGALAVVVEVTLENGVLAIRQWDWGGGQPIDGSDGVIETYPYQELEDGRVRVDFEAPGVPLEVHFGGGCTYGLQEYILADSPQFEDDLLTWTVVEVYESEGCGEGGVPSSFGMNVHYLRRYDANPDFEPRSPDEDMPFGFFRVNFPLGEKLTRLPYTGAGYEDGQVVYYLDPDFPEDTREFLYDIFDHWNLVLNATAGNRPFLLKESPPSLVPWDPRYRVVDWDGSQSRGAIAPFIPHPATGEIFDSDVIVWLGDVDDLVQSYADFFQANPDHPYDFGLGEDTEMPSPFGDSNDLWMPEGWDDSSGLPARVLRRQPVPFCPLSMEHIHQLFVTYGMSLTTEEIEQLIILSFISHEVGHNLGLRHNFKASLDKDHHAATITATSVMDYVMGMSFPGTYDADAMRYAYGDGAIDDTFLYCTDEDLDLDPGCAHWDLGHPVSYAIGVLDKLIATYPPDTPQEEVQAVAQEREWSDRFRQLRQFLNTDYELWNPEAPVLMFNALLDRALCKEYPDETDEGPTPAEEEPSDEEPAVEPVACDTHLWFRQQTALYLLYTKYVVDDEWYDFPGLQEEQIDLLFQRFFQLLTDPGQSMGLKQTIIEKLPTSAVPGAGDFQQELQEHFAGIEAPTADEQQLLDWLQE
ncbi:MAG: zinc-dependent metalloprotease [Myxococcota bacterium]|nr:zinc-dependent metalloprotease [Myxococcota bacterium]